MKNLKETDTIKIILPQHFTTKPSSDEEGVDNINNSIIN